MRKAIIVHETYPYGNNLIEWSLKTLPIQSTDKEVNKELISKAKYAQNYAKRMREHHLKRIAELLGLKEDQYEIIDSVHAGFTYDNRFLICAQDASMNHKFLRYSDGKLNIYRGRGNASWCWAAPSTVYSDRANKEQSFRVDDEDFTLHVKPTGELIETCELIGGGKTYLDGRDPEVKNIETAF